MSITKLNQATIVETIGHLRPMTNVNLVSTTNADGFQIDLDEMPPDETLLEGEHLSVTEVLPWRRFGTRLVYVSAEPDTVILPPNPHGIDNTNVLSADPDRISQFIARFGAAEELRNARHLCPEVFSCRGFKINMRNPKFIVMVLFVVTTVAAFPHLWMFGLLALVMVSNLATTALRFFALLFWNKDSQLPDWLDTSSDKRTPFREPMRVSILVPLFKEDGVLPALVRSLERLEYPHEHLEVIFLLEEVDTITANSITAIALPAYIRCVTVPKDWLQTKPKAMNFALPKCTGEIIGIYDAEDRPDPDQIHKVVEHFLSAPANVACVQGYLDFYNSRSNWISRCFTIEYATWFRVVLKGIQNLGLPIPLGGTTVFFRRRILEEIGGWDAHNVTEDADLGMRLARFGYRCEMVNTTTWEEANNVPLAWVRQRSRWLKGFAMTWSTHMRDPAALWRDLGAAGFISFQVVMLGGLSAFLAAPVFWALWMSQLAHPILPADIIPPTLWWVLGVVLVSGQLVNLTAISRATRHDHLRHLIPYILLLPIYWPLGMLASYKAITELFFAPFYWDKTFHGRDHEDQP